MTPSFPRLRFSAPLRKTDFFFTRRRGEAETRRLFPPLVLLLSVLMIPTALLADSRMPVAPLANTQLADPKQEAAARELMLSIRCLVCQGQSIADSDAEMAADMRSLIRARVQAGEKPEDIRAWLVERYGNWVTYEPPLDMTTAPLWIAPLLLLAIGAYLARGRFRRRR